MRTQTTFGGSRIGATFTEDFDILKNFKQFAEQAYRSRVDQILLRLTQRVTMSTAVWQGETLVNWKWSLNSPDFSYREAEDSGPPGHTNVMSLGSEPRRPANEQPVWTSLGRVRAMRAIPDRIFLTNTGTVAEAMEYGLVPGGRGQRVRASFMLRLAVAEATLLKY